jgi:hypothetical protein
VNIGPSTINHGDNPTIGKMVIELGNIPLMETTDKVYLKDIIRRLHQIELKLDKIQTRLDESLWERIKRWLGIR